MSNPYGKALRARRVAAELSLRTVAGRLGVSHVYLGEVERGVRPPLKKERWEKLASIVPTFNVTEQAQLAETSRPIQMNLAEAPPEYQDLGLALARRIEARDLDRAKLNEILRFLRGDGDE